MPESRLSSLYIEPWPRSWELRWGKSGRSRLGRADANQERICLPLMDRSAGCEWKGDVLHDSGRPDSGEHDRDTAFFHGRKRGHSSGASALGHSRERTDAVSVLGRKSGGSVRSGGGRGELGSAVGRGVFGGGD